jgi:hypothetical protein
MIGPDLLPMDAQLQEHGYKTLASLDPALLKRLQCKLSLTLCCRSGSPCFWGSSSTIALILCCSSSFSFPSFSALPLAFALCMHVYDAVLLSAMPLEFLTSHTKKEHVSESEGLLVVRVVLYTTWLCQKL